MFEHYIDMIEQDGITVDILSKAIGEHSSMRERMAANYERYKAIQGSAAVPIYTRTFENEAANKVNNQLSNPFDREIVDTKVGYLFGVPVSFSLDKKASQYEEALARIERFRKVNSLDDFNGETGKFSSICGYDGWLAYVDREAQERVMRIDPWECIILSRSEITEPFAGIRYYRKNDDTVRVEYYDATHKRVFEGPDYAKLTEIGPESKANMFDYCPLFGYPNNGELQGDAEPVYSLMENFDKAMSDMSSEIEQFRLAYMLIYGQQPPAEGEDDMVDHMRRTGALYIPDIESGQKVEFLVKDLNADFVNAFLDRSERNIERFAMHVNFTEAFGGGTVTGPAMRYKLFMLEAKTKKSERKHEAAMLYLFKLLGSAWRKKGFSFDYTQLDVKYTRNVPVNILDEAQAAAALMSVTSRQTAISTLSFVSDPEEEMERVAAEREEQMDLDMEMASAGGNDDGGQSE